MNNIEKQLHKLKNVKLSETKRESIRYALIQHMEQTQKKSVWDFRFMMKYSTAFVLAFIVTGGGLSYAAAASLPGDVLYPIKIHVSEKAEVVLAPQIKKIEIKKKHVENRFIEIETLAREDKLTPETHSIAQNQLEKDFEGFDQALEKLEKEESVSIALTATASIEPVVEHHNEVMKELTKNSDEEKALSATITAVAQTKIDNLNKKEEILIAQAEEKESKKEVAKESIAEIAQNKLKEAQEKLDNLNTETLEYSYVKNTTKVFENELSGDELLAPAELPKKVKSIDILFETENTLIDAELYFENEEYGNSLRSSQKAIRLTEELSRIVSDEAKGEFEPEALTDDLSILYNQNQTLIEEIDLLGNEEEQVTPSDVLPKIKSDISIQTKAELQTTEENEKSIQEKETSNDTDPE